LFVSLVSVDWFNCTANLAAALNVDFIFGLLLLFLLKYLQTGLLYILYTHILHFLIISVLYVTSVFNRHILLSFLHVCNIYHLLGDSIIINNIVIFIFLFSPIRDLLSQLILFFNLQLTPPLNAQVSGSNNFRIMCDVQSTAVFCIGSIEYFPVLPLYYGNFFL